MSLGKNPAHLSMVGARAPPADVGSDPGQPRRVHRLPCGARSNQHDKTVEKYVACLRLGGYVEAIRGLKRGEEVVFRLIRDNGVEAPNLNADGKPSQQGYTTEAVWRTLRILGPSTPEQIAASVAASGTPVSPSTVQRYFIDLQNAGYLTRNGRHYALAGPLHRSTAAHCPARDAPSGLRPEPGSGHVEFARRVPAQPESFAGRCPGWRGGYRREQRIRRLRP